jgi:hypothetical protein
LALVTDATYAKEKSDVVSATRSPAVASTTQANVA